MVLLAAVVLGVDVVHVVHAARGVLDGQDVVEDLERPNHVIAGDQESPVLFHSCAFVQEFAAEAKQRRQGKKRRVRVLFVCLFVCLFVRIGMHTNEWSAVTILSSARATMDAELMGMRALKDRTTDRVSRRTIVP